MFSGFGGYGSGINVGPLRFVTLFWPKKVKASKLEEIHGKMVMKGGGGGGGGAAKQTPEIPKKTGGGKVNGSTNGKIVR